ncbi:MAG: hypothetical protein WKG07_32890 [Hymenobacter sp.]
MLSIHSAPVAIEEIEKHIIEIAFEKGYARPVAPVLKTGKTVAVVGSGPAGLAVAAQLTEAGHVVLQYLSATRTPAACCATACPISSLKNG